MIKFFKTHLLLFAMITVLLVPQMTKALNIGMTYTVNMQKLKREEPKKGELNNRDGNRIPPRPIICTISETDGIQIDLCNDDIYAYEVWNETAETCFASYNDETDFVQYIFSIPGTYQIKLITEEYVYTGCISTL